MFGISLWWWRKVQGALVQIMHPKVCQTEVCPHKVNGRKTKPRKSTELVRILKSLPVSKLQSAFLCWRYQPNFEQSFHRLVLSEINIYKLSNSCSIKREHGLNLELLKEKLLPFPRVTGIIPVKQLITVVFPAPFGPRRQNNWSFSRFNQSPWIKSATFIATHISMSAMMKIEKSANVFAVLIM